MKISKYLLRAASLTILACCLFSCEDGTRDDTDTATDTNIADDPSEIEESDMITAYSFLNYDPASSVYGLSGDDVIAYYTGGSDGEYTDSSDNHHNGQAYNIAYSDGICGNAAVFDGNDSYIEIPKAALDTEDITISFWAYWNGGDEGQTVFDFAKSEKRRMYFSPCESYVAKGQSLMRFLIGNGGAASFLRTENPMPVGEWTHVCIVLEKDIGRLYINGRLKDTNTSMTVNPADIIYDTAYIGKNSVNNRKFNGKLDEFLICGRALDADEVLRLASPVSFYYSADSENNPENLSAFVTEHGYTGKGLEFDGTKYLTVTEEKVGRSALGFAGFVYCEKNDSDMTLLSLGSGGDRLCLSKDKDGKITLDSTAGGESSAVECDDLIESESWHHIALTLDGDVAAVYIDGKLSGEGNLPCTYSDIDSCGLYIAGDPASDGSFYGRMDEIVILSSVADGALIEALSVPTLLKYSLDGSLTDEITGKSAVISGVEEYADGYIPEVRSLKLDGACELIFPDYVSDCAEVTFTLWINAQKQDKDGVLFSINKDNGGICLSLCKDGKLILSDASSGAKTESASAIPTDTWVQLAVTVGRGAEIFVDGSSVISASDVNALKSDPENVKIAIGDKENGYAGLVCCVGVYADVLDEEAICRLQRDVIDFPSYDDNFTYLKAGDQKIIESYSYWGIPQMHDGEIVKYDGYYYIYSTDCIVSIPENTETPLRPGIQMRRSKDLINWEFYGWAMEEVPKEAIEWTGTDNMLWAPSINKIGDKWYMYYSVSSLGNRQTFLGTMTADSPLGPWHDEGEVFKVSNNDKNYLVNPIDPNLFFDKNGDPWLVYGSYYGGIYVNRIDPETGKFAEYGEGKCIARRTEVIGVDKPNSIEGPFIIYNKELDEYVLFVSYGSFTTDYSLRIAKSKTPDGEYLDFDGVSLADTKHQMTSPLPTPVGTKIMGSYKFADHYGWVGLGHNAVYEEDGEWYCLNNSHFIYDTSYCYMQIRKLLWTEDGWPIVSPEFYAGEKEQDIPEKSIVGEWELIMLELANDNLKKSESVKIACGGKIEKDDSAGGRWSYLGGNRFEFDYKNKKIKGYVMPAWDWERWNPCLVFSGLDEDGNATWGKCVG